MGKSLKRNEDGMAMVLVIMAMLVFSLLGMASLSMANSNVDNSLLEREFQSAFYVAEAGVNYHTEVIKKNIKAAYDSTNTPDDFFNALETNPTTNKTYTTDLFHAQEGYIPEAKVELKRLDMSQTNPRTYSIVSRGTSNHATRVVKKLITIKYVEGFSLNSFKGVYSKGLMTIENSGKIYSEIASETGIKMQGNPNISDYYLISGNLDTSNISWWPTSPSQKGQKKTLTPVEYNLPEFPEFPDFDQKIDFDGISSGLEHRTITLTKDKTYIPTIYVSGSCRLTIKVGDKDRELIVDNFNIPQGYINIEGTGSLKLYVKGNIEFGGGTIINHPNPPTNFATANQEIITNNAKNATKEQCNAAADKLSIYYKGTENEGTNKNFRIHGNQYLYGSVFAEDANVKIDGSGVMVGNLITGGKSVDIGGGSGISSNLIYAPDAHVYVDGSGKINGPIVSNTFTFNGGELSSMEFNPDDGLAGDTFDIVTPGEVIITEGVAREQ